MVEIRPGAAVVRERVQLLQLVLLSHPSQLPQHQFQEQRRYHRHLRHLQLQEASSNP